MTLYAYRQGIDYGPRKGTLGLSFHMSEGGDGLAEYLAQRSGETRMQWITRVNGVSCHAAILSTGQVIQMLDWRSSSGNLNPNDRAGEYGYYGHHHLVDVLGEGWTDPNAWTISAELAGRRLTGPTERQAAAAIAWGLDMKARFPTLRGAVGHHDQSPKGCPGTTPNMKTIFAGLGGHGLWTERTMPPIILDPGLRYAANVVPKEGVPILREPNNEGPVIRRTAAGERFRRVGMDGTFHVIEAQDEEIGSFTAYIARGNVNADEPIPDVVDCTDAVEVIKARVREAIA